MGKYKIISGIKEKLKVGLVSGLAALIINCGDNGGSSVGQYTNTTPKQYVTETAGDDNKETEVNELIDSDEDGYKSDIDCNDSDINNWNSCSSCNDYDNDGWFENCDAYVTINGPDLNDNNASVYPEASEICDGVDNDKNSTTQDGSWEISPFNTNQNGACFESVQSCTGGTWQDDYSGIDNYEATEISCDGVDNDCDGQIDKGCVNKISFISDRNGNYDIYTIDTDGNNLEQITNTSWNEYSHSWSPDGKKIVYQSDEGSNPKIDEYYSNIYIINSDGTNKINLTNSEAGIYNGMPDLSFDGKQIVFVSNRESRDTYHLYIIDIDTNNLRQVTDSGVDYNHFQPEFSNNGNEIAFSEAEIYGPAAFLKILNLKDGSIREIENGAEATQTPTFSPDSKFIAFCSNLSDPINFLVNLGIMNLETKEMKEITTNGKSYNPNWSPNGKEIVYQFLNEDTWKNSVRKINLETNEETILAESDDFNNTAPNWFFYLE